MEPKIVLITGANSGIGKAAALRFTREGHHVVMACRNLERGERARAEIMAETGSSTVDLMQVDVASFASVRAFAGAYHERYPRLDILIHNAGYFSHGEPFRTSEDGIEMAYACNVFAPYLLTWCLLDSLKQSDDPRILHAGSNIVTHFFDPKKKLDLGYLQGLPSGEKGTSVYERYRNSKMAFLMLTFMLARKLAAHGIAVNTLQINGATMSKETVRKFRGVWKLIAHIQNLFLKPPSHMANAYYEITTAERFAGVTGKNFNATPAIIEAADTSKGNVIQAFRTVAGNNHYPIYADDAQLQDEIWGLCEELTGVAFESKTLRDVRGEQ